MQTLFDFAGPNYAIAFHAEALRGESIAHEGIDRHLCTIALIDRGHRLALNLVLMRLLLAIILELLDCRELLNVIVYCRVYLPSYVGGGLSSPLPVVDVGSSEARIFP